jgi:hypothetical protein
LSEESDRSRVRSLVVQYPVYGAAATCLELLVHPDGSAPQASEYLLASIQVHSCWSVNDSRRWRLAVATGHATIYEWPREMKRVDASTPR